MSEPTGPDANGKKMFADVDLETPIVRGETTIDKVQLRRPLGGALRGLSTLDLVRMEYNAIRTVVPRISTPPVLEQDFDRMDGADILTISTEVAGFFLPRGMSPDSLAQ